MADDSDDLIISISTDVATLRRSNKRLEAAMGDTLNKIEKLTSGTSAKMDASFAKGANNMASSMRKVEFASRGAGRAGIDASAAFAKFFAVVGSAKGFQSLVDSSIRMTNSLKVAGLQGDALQGTLNKLYASALRNHAPIEGLTTLYGRAALQQKELGASSSQLITFTDTVGKALRVSGTSASEAEGSLLQLSQALGSGTVHAEEFNSILEGMPALAQAAAKGIKQANGSVAELKNLVINQKISSRALFDGIIAGASDLDTKLQGTGTTIGQAFTDLRTALTRAVGEFNTASGAGKAAVDIIVSAANRLNELNFVKLAGELQGIIAKLNEMGKSYDNLLNSANQSGAGLHDWLMDFSKSINGGKPVINLGGAFSNQPIDIDRLSKEYEERQKHADADELKALQDQLDAANKLQKAMGLPVNNQANIELLRQMDEIRDKTNAAKDAVVSLRDASEKQGPPNLMRFQKKPGFKDELPPASQVDITDPRYAANSKDNAEKLKKTYDDLVQSAKDRNEQIRQEIQLVGKSGAVLDAARVKLQMMQKAQSEGITGDNLKNIQALADAYGKLAQQLAGASMVQGASERNQLLQQEIDLVGKSGVALDTARYKLELLQEAQKNGVNGEALKNIEAQIDAYGRLSETLARVKLSQDLNDQNRLAAMPDRDRQIVTMQRQYGLSEDPNSDTGRAIGQNIDRQANREAVTSFMTDFKDGLVKNGESIGKAFGTALQNALTKQADKLWENLFNKIGNALFPGSPTNLGTTSGTAATGVVGLGATTVGRLISPASISSQPMPAISSAGTTKTSISLARIATSNGLGADVNAKYAQQFQGFIKDLEGTGYKIKSIGGYNYRNIAGTNKLSNHAFGDAIDINPQQNPMGKNLVTDLPSNVGELAAKNGLSWGGAWNSKKDAMHFEVPSSAAALDKLASSAGNATKGLGTFGTGVGQLGQQLTSATSNIFPTAPAASGGGGGVFGWLGGLFGSGSSQFKAASAGKLLPGLFADGGYTGPGGKNTPAGIVHAGEFVVPKHIVDKIGVPALSTMMKGYADGGLVTPGLVSAPTAPALRARSAVNGGNNQPGVLHVQISGASGDEHVRTLVKQGVGEGLNQYNTQQQRGGFGTLQSRFNAQKG
ncbi:tape measure protein [Rhizobium rhizogenes]|uniref:Uncharacterized protein n=1 Tax=Rhizobium rhizogenes (strain K84 / ATCC BAA-868) TaxID=311403 RepID=B9JF39_RHIR8|nr:conserved hypothetical protein [Rhizobium rhizogenes K84]